MRRTLLNGVAAGLVILLVGGGCLWISPPPERVLAKGRAADLGARIHKEVSEEHFRQVWPRAQAALSRLPGVVNVHPGQSTIHVVTEKPSSVPAEFEGIPIQTFTVTQQKESQ
jgi:hypothetical protein